MTARRQPVANAQIKRILAIAKEQGYPIPQCALEVGPDYVRITPPASGESELAQYIGPSHSPQAGQKR